MDLLLQEFLERLEKESIKYPDLLPFFRCVFTFYYVFPISELNDTPDKTSFINMLSNGKSLPRMRFIFDSLAVKENTLIIDYLKETYWWWEVIHGVSKEGIDIYRLSYLYETLTRTQKKKNTGLFFTPQNQVQFICYFSLYKYLMLNNALVIDQSLIHRIIFQGKISQENQDIYKTFVNQLSSTSIIDPSCGTGLFLHEIIEIYSTIIFKIKNSISNYEYQQYFQKFLSNLYGFDIDPTHVILTKLVFLHHWITKVVSYESISVGEMKNFVESIVNIKKENFLLIEEPSNLKFDLCLGNPPYIRHHNIDKKKIIAKLVTIPEYQSIFSGSNQQVDSKADLYFYFWIMLMFKLNPNGVLGLVLSRSWYSSRFLSPINSLLLEKYFNIDLILELPSEPWKKAEIITNIIIGHKVEHFDEVNSTTVLVWKKKLSELLKIDEPLSEYIDSVEQLRSTQLKDINIESFENNEYRMSRITNSHLLFSRDNTYRFPIMRIDYFTMAPFFLHHILLANKDKFCLLNHLGKLSLGSTTGANRYFYLSEDMVQKFSLSQKHLVSMTKSPKDFISLSIIAPQKSLYLLSIPPEINIEKDVHLQHYLDSIKNDILSRPYFLNKSKSTWYCISKIQPEILIPNMTYLRSFVAYNTQELHVDKQWIGFWPDSPVWTEFLLGFMNSSLGVLLREIQGTRTLGLGSLKLSLSECQNLLVLDPRQMPDTTIHQIKECLQELIELHIPKIGEKTKYLKIQMKLDQLLCVDYLGLSPHFMDQIQQSIKFEVEWRLGKPIL